MKLIACGTRQVSNRREHKHSQLRQYHGCGPDTWARGARLGVSGLRPRDFVLATKPEGGRGDNPHGRAPDDEFHLGSVGEVVHYPGDVHLSWWKANVMGSADPGTSIYTHCGKTIYPSQENADFAPVGILLIPTPGYSIIRTSDGGAFSMPESLNRLEADLDEVG